MRALLAVLATGLAAVLLPAAAAAQERPCPPGAEVTHWVRDVKMNGGLLMLDDGSEWDVRPADTGVTALWFPGAPVVVLEGGRPNEPPNYLLVNRSNLERALATKVTSPERPPVQ